MTPTQREALEWLHARGGDGSLQRGGRCLAQGEIAPHMPETWIGLASHGCVEFYRMPMQDRGHGRIKVTLRGRGFALGLDRRRA